jgi:non-ribosomal peptide synthase protein (TIGR01720 family)
LDYWINFPWDKAATLPSDYPERFCNDAAIMDAINNKKLLDAYQTDIVLADEELTMRMFGQFGTDLENALIVIFFLAVSRMNLEWMDMNVCNSGRNILPSDYGINFFHLMGFLAVNRVVMLKRPESNDLTSDFHHVIEQIKNIPNAGIGYHLLGHYIKNEQLRNSFMGFRRRPFVFFNYLGRIDSNLGNDQYEMVEEDCGVGSYENEIQNNMLECFAGIKENQLFYKFTYCDAYLKKETIQEIKQAIAETMRALAPARAEHFIEKVA